MELDPDALRSAARRWAVLAHELAGGASLLRGAPTAGLGEATHEAALLLHAGVDAVSRLRHDAGELVDGLLLTAGVAVEVDDRVAATLARIDPGAWS